MPSAPAPSPASNSVASKPSKPAKEGQAEKDTRLVDMKRSLTVRNIPFQVKESQLLSFLSSVEGYAWKDITMVVVKTGYAFVEFKDEQAMTEAHQSAASKAEPVFALACSQSLTLRSAWMDAMCASSRDSNATTSHAALDDLAKHLLESV